MDQIQSIRVFARVVEAGTFTKAAESLNLPKGTVTKLVQHLESRLKVKLLNRTTRRVTVTPDGASYYERTTRLLPARANARRRGCVHGAITHTAQPRRVSCAISRHPGGTGRERPHGGPH